MTANELRALLPWTHPFLMLDGMLECVPHERVVTLKRVTSDDAMAEGGDWEGLHFPTSLVLEGMSQSAALLFRLSYGPDALAGAPLLGHLNATLSGAPSPGDTIEYTVRAVKMTSRSGIFAGTARVDGAEIATAELAFGVGAG